MAVDNRQAITGSFYRLQSLSAILDEVEAIAQHLQLVFDQFSADRVVFGDQYQASVRQGMFAVLDDIWHIFYRWLVGVDGLFFLLDEQSGADFFNLLPR
ncbi:hypothetical protein D3C76_1535200 [compost metagenome]